MIENKIYAHLSTSTSITIVCSVSTRIYPMTAPQETIYPCLVYSRITGGQYYTLNGYADIENPIVRIDVLSQSYKECKTISTSLKTVMDNAITFRARLADNSDTFIADIQIYQHSMEFSCWNRE